MRETATNNSVQGEEIQKVNLVKISARINHNISEMCNTWMQNREKKSE